MQALRHARAHLRRIEADAARRGARARVVRGLAQRALRLQRLARTA
jgi:hypothetical protein